MLLISGSVISILGRIQLWQLEGGAMIERLELLF
jgi:hypothetical protein